MIVINLWVFPFDISFHRGASDWTDDSHEGIFSLLTSHRFTKLSWRTKYILNSFIMNRKLLDWFKCVLARKQRYFDIENNMNFTHRLICLIQMIKWWHVELGLLRTKRRFALSCWLTGRKIESLPWSSYSPDLNSIENTTKNSKLCCIRHWIKSSYRCCTKSRLLCKKKKYYNLRSHCINIS